MAERALPEQPYSVLRRLAWDIRDHKYQLAQAGPLGIGKKRQKMLALSLASLQKMAAQLRRALRRRADGK